MQLEVTKDAGGGGSGLENKAEERVGIPVTFISTIVSDVFCSLFLHTQALPKSNFDSSSSEAVEEEQSRDDVTTTQQKRKGT